LYSKPSNSSKSSLVFRDIKTALERKYIFNFVGSLSSKSRKQLSNLLFPPRKTRLSSFVDSENAFIHIIEQWRLSITRKNGYISSDSYRNVLMDSVFTLCPGGHNPEAYRIYETCIAGSIPILVYSDEKSKGQVCKDSFAPFKQSNAPFVWLKDWSQLGGFLHEFAGNHTFIMEKQKQVRQWYVSFMRDFAYGFEEVLYHRFLQRTNIERARNKYA